MLDDVGECLPLGLPVEAVPEEHPVPPLLLAGDVTGHSKHHGLPGVPHHLPRARLVVTGAGLGAYCLRVPVWIPVSCKVRPHLKHSFTGKKENAVDF